MSELKCTRTRRRRILIIALLAIALVFTASAGPQSPYIMGDANPHHEFVGPTLPSGKVQP